MASSLEKLAQSHGDSHGIALQWRSFELRPKDAPPISPDYRARIEAGRPRLYAIAREQYGLAMNPGPFGFDSRPALTGAKFAESHGQGPAYHARIMQAYWQEAQDIGDLNVLAELAVAVGLDRAEFQAALQSPVYQQAVLADVSQAYAYGINGVPAMIFADKYLVSGAQPYEVLCRAVEQIAAEREKDGTNVGA